MTNWTDGKIKEVQSTERQTEVVKIPRYITVRLASLEKVELERVELNWGDFCLGMSQMNASVESSTMLPTLATKLSSRQPFWAQLIKLHWSATFLFIFINIYLFLRGDFWDHDWLTVDSCLLSLMYSEAIVDIERGNTLRGFRKYSPLLVLMCIRFFVRVSKRKSSPRTFFSSQRTKTPTQTLATFSISFETSFWG